MSNPKIDRLNRYHESPIHYWFGLTYSNYLVLPRSLMEGMPHEWQEKMVALLDDMRQIYDDEKIEDSYTVHLRDKKGRFKSDPLANYRHPPELPYRDTEERHEP